MPTREFFKGDPEYGTRVKLTMLNHFIRPWAAKLAEWARLSGKKRIWFVDLFAGEGLLGSGILGSPLIAAKLAAERIMANESVELAIFAVEEDKHSFQELEKNAAPYRARGVTFKSRQGEWTQYLDEVVSLTDGDPVLLFVDPFGLTGVRFATLDPLLGRQTPTDLIVRLHDPAIYRNADQYPELISEGLATTSWNLGWTPNLSIEQRMHIARSAYKKSIERRMPADTKVVSYPVRRRLGGPSEYTLFYASKNESGIELWHEEIGRHFRSLHQGAGTNTPQASFLPEVTLEIRQAEIRELVQSRISETGGATGQQLIDWIRLDREDYILSSEIRDALRELEMQGYVAREDGGRGYKHVKFIPSSPPPEQGTFQL